MIHRLRKIVSVSASVMQLQDNVNDFVEDVVSIPVLPGNLIAATVTSAGTAISHGLSRQPVGWFLADIDAASTVYRSAWDTRNITLVSSAPSVNISIWVF